MRIVSKQHCKDEKVVRPEHHLAGDIIEERRFAIFSALQEVAPKGTPYQPYKKTLISTVIYLRLTYFYIKAKIRLNIKINYV